MLFAFVAAAVIVVTLACLAPKPDRARVGEALQAVRSGRATPRHRRLLGRRAAQFGARELAERYYMQADIQDAIFDWERTYKSPLPGVSNLAWQKWLERNEQPLEMAEEHKDRTLLYGLRPRELDDAGLAVPTTDEDEYTAFVAVVRHLLRGLEGRFADKLGAEIEGEKATLSGLLAVARCAGIGGLATWAENAAERAQFARTTQAYKRCNGLF